jgi:hypothetical protein
LAKGPEIRLHIGNVPLTAILILIRSLLTDSLALFA